MKRHWTNLVIFAAFITAVPSMAADRALITCGDLDGYSVFAPNSKLGPSGGGWVKDAISPGQAVLFINNDSQLDIQMQDAAGRMTYLDLGCAVSANDAPKDAGSFIVTAICKLSVDTFLFAFPSSSWQGKLLYTQAKSTPNIVKAAVFTANCRRE
jgi:hypothetical protein